MGHAVALFLLLLTIATQTPAQTRLYIQNTTESFDPAAQGTWDDVTPDAGTLRFPCRTTKLGPIASVTNTEASNVDRLKILVVKCISAPLGSDQTLGGAGSSVNWMLGTMEANSTQDDFWRVHVWVSQGSTNAVRGTLLNRYEESAATAPTNEWPPAHAKGWKNNGANVGLASAPVGAVAGDRIVIEIGAVLNRNAVTAYASQLWIGGTDPVDLQQNGDETKLPGWIELSQNIAFDNGPIATPTATVPPPATDTATVAPPPTETGTHTPVETPATATPTRTPSPTPSETAIPVDTATPGGGGLTFTVNSVLDLRDILPIDTLCATSLTPPSVCTLRAAVESANGNPGAGTVQLPPGTYAITLGEMAVAGNLLIQGTGSSAAAVVIKLTGLTTPRGFNVAPGASLTLRNLTILDNRNEINTALKGACVYNAGTTTLDNAVLDHCDNARALTAPVFGQGGGVYNDGTLLCRNGSRFDTGVSNWGACLFNAKNATADISDCEFLNCHTLGLDDETAAETGNTAAGGGAGIFNVGTINANRTSFIYCRARLGLGGGAILNGDALGDTGLGVGGTVNLTNVTFARNRCRRCEGGAFKSYGGTINAKLTTVAFTQAAFVSGIILRDGAVLNADRMIIDGHNVSDPSSGFEMCFTANGAQVNVIGPAPSMDNSGDTTPPRITCPGFMPVADLCIMTDNNYGGFVDTTRLGSSLTCKSPAIDAGGPTCGVSEDARGFPRPVGAGCDLGAFEVQ